MSQTSKYKSIQTLSLLWGPSSPTGWKKHPGKSAQRLIYSKGALVEHAEQPRVLNEWECLSACGDSSHTPCPYKCWLCPTDTTQSMHSSHWDLLTALGCWDCQGKEQESLCSSSELSCSLGSFLSLTQVLRGCRKTESALP